MKKYIDYEEVVEEIGNQRWQFVINNNELKKPKQLMVSDDIRELIGVHLIQDGDKGIFLGMEVLTVSRAYGKIENYIKVV